MKENIGDGTDYHGHVYRISTLRLGKISQQGCVRKCRSSHEMEQIDRATSYAFDYVHKALDLRIPLPHFCYQSILKRNNLPGYDRQCHHEFDKDHRGPPDVLTHEQGLEFIG